jgi:predicted methyltransferase
VRAASFEDVVDKAIFGEVEAVDFGPNHTDAILAGSANLILVARAFQNWAREGDARDMYLAAFFRMLKPGGFVWGVDCEFRRNPDTDSDLIPADAPI